MKGILRLKQSQLEHRDGLLCYQGQAFRGNSYSLDGDRVVDIARVEQGRVVERYKPELVPGPALTMTPFENEHGFHYDDEPYEYEGKAFNGTIYDFDGCLCSIYEIEDGESVAEQDFYKDGQLEAYRKYTQHFSEEIEFNPDASHSLLHASISGGKFRLNFREGMLGTFELSEGFFELENLKDLTHEGLYRMNTVLTQEFHPNLMLSGSGIDNHVLSQITSCKSFAKCEALVLWYTQVTAEGIAALGSLKNISSLDINADGSDLEAILGQLKSHRPEMEIRYNEQLL